VNHLKGIIMKNTLLLAFCVALAFGSVSQAFATKAAGDAPTEVTKEATETCANDGSTDGCTSKSE
jgi:hypothetical protein